MIATAPQTHDLNAFLRAHHMRFKAIAHAWQEAGAIGIGISVNGEWLKLWPESFPTDVQAVSVALKFGSVTAEMWVFGAEGTAAEARLTADSTLLSRLFSLEYEMRDMTQELIGSQDQLLALFSISNAMQDQLTLEAVMNTLTTESSKLFNVAYSIGYFPGEGGHFFHYPRPLLDHNQILHDFQEVIRSGKRQFVYNVVAFDVLHDHLMGVIEPIRVRGEVQAALCLFKQGSAFESPELKLLSGVCDQAGAQIKSVQLYQETLAQARLQTEMEVAKKVQIHLLPQRLPSVTGLDVAAASLPALQVGGDFYDFSSEAGKPFIFSVGDVTGKGMPAALLMAMTRTLLKSKTRTFEQPSPVDVLGSVNDEMYDDFTEIGMFSTLFIGLYSHWEHALYFANAGHSPVIYYPAGGSAMMLDADGPPVGVLPICTCENQVIEFQPGDILLVGTDGFSEAQNQQGEMFGYDRLLALVENCAQESAQVILDNLFRAVSTFSNGHAQDDDQTVVILKGVS